jgi:hypothetical protein
VRNDHRTATSYQKLAGYFKPKTAIVAMQVYIIKHLKENLPEKCRIFLAVHLSFMRPKKAKKVDGTAGQPHAVKRRIFPCLKNLNGDNAVPFSEPPSFISLPRQGRDTDAACLARPNRI